MDAILGLAAGLLLLAAVVTHALLRPREAPAAPAHAVPEGAPHVSVVVPCRNEAHNLQRLLASLRALEGVSFDVLVVDGGSSDGTPEIVEQLAREDPRFRLLQEPPLPPGWVGKSWACWNGRRAARGAWLLFTDADTWHAPDSLARAVASAQRAGAGLLTGVTRQELETFWERVAMPPIFTLIYAAGGGAGAERIRDPALAIANGQYLLFDARAYDRIGGHAAVRGTVVEDLALARLAARAGEPAVFMDLTGLVRVRMYRGLADMFQGWRKNVAVGASRTPPPAYAMAVATFHAGLLAAPLALVALASGAWVAAAFAGLTYGIMAWRIRAAQAMAEGPRWRHALLHPLGYGFFAAALLASVFDRWSGRGPEWKGRRYPWEDGKTAALPLPEE